MSLPEAKRILPAKLCKIMKGHTDAVRGVIRLPDRQQVISCSLDGSLRIWNSQTGEQISNSGNKNVQIRGIALFADGKKAVGRGSNRDVTLWNIETQEVIAKWEGHTSTVSSVCWNRDGQRVLSTGKTARLWDVDSGKMVLEINTGLKSLDIAIFSPDSSLIATGGNHWKDSEKQIKIWDANTGELVSSLKGHTACVNRLVWTDSLIISGSVDHTIRTWDTFTWQQVAVLAGHTGQISDIALSPNGRILASASWSYWDRSARLWNLEDGQPIGFPLQHLEDVNCVSFSTDGMLLVTGCEDKNIYTWDIASIVEEAGLKELLDVDQSSLHADAMPHPIQEPDSES